VVDFLPQLRLGNGVFARRNRPKANEAKKITGRAAWPSMIEEFNEAKILTIHINAKHGIYQRLEQWLSQTAPQLNLTMGKSPPWLLLDPTQATRQPLLDPLALHTRFPTADSRRIDLSLRIS
jgi:hypothetical protein